MENKRFIPVLALCAVLLCPSCSVHEDRRDCPASLRFEVRNTKAFLPSRSVSFEVRSSGSGDRLGRDSQLLEVLGSDDYRMAVKKDLVDVGGITGGAHGKLSSTRYTYPVGSPSDTIYHFHVHGIDATGEEATVPVMLTKEFCRLNVLFKYDENEDFIYEIRVRGNTCGLDLMTGEPIEGAFSTIPYSPSKGAFTTVVPRQRDDSMIIEIWANGKNPSENGHLEDIELSKYLGYIPGFSWGMADLPDITVRIDYVRASFEIWIEDWQVGRIFNYII
ncbi:MAG: hypothetical protein IJR77_00895 [Bacteroidales bacterium]|nr:hypothetical protein [Bacteroidales bacterium]